MYTELAKTFMSLIFPSLQENLAEYGLVLVLHTSFITERLVTYKQLLNTDEIYIHYGIGTLSNLLWSSRIIHNVFKEYGLEGCLDGNSFTGLQPCVCAIKTERLLQQLLKHCA